MPAFPLSPRLLALPWWALVHLRCRVRERGRPLLRLHVNLRQPLPSAEALLRVASASDVRGIHLCLEELHAGWAKLAEARAALARVRASGKLVVVELERCGNAELYLSSVAQHVWMRPLGEVQALGVAAVLRFAGAAFARFGVRFDFEAAGTYKSFGEMWTRAYASAANREATLELVEELQAELESAVAEGRGLPRERVRAAFAEGPLGGEEARERGLVDALLYPDEVLGKLDELLGEDVRVVPFHRWEGAARSRDRVEAWIEQRRRVVVLHLRGPVVDGEGPPGVGAIAAGPVCRALKDLREDEDTAAVVLAIDSPGGSALASDLIWREVELLNRSKVVVAAFGDVSASGGFYIAAPATEIWALPNTITGSIGVVGGKVVTAGAAARFGVHSEVVAGAPRATMYRPEAPFSPEERLRFREGLQRFYEAFVSRVAAGRKRTYAAVEEHARGRVWTGRRALELGLVDHLGGTAEAVARAALLGGVRSPARIDRVLAPRSNRFARLVRSWVESASPELGLLRAWWPDGASATLTMLHGSSGRALYWWPFEVDPR